MRRLTADSGSFSTSPASATRKTLKAAATLRVRRPSPRPPPPPQEPQDPEDQEDQHREREEGGVDLHHPPPAAERPAETHERPGPGRAAEEGVAQEPPPDGHALETSGDRDQGPHPGDEVADQDGHPAVPLEGPARPLQVRAVDELGSLCPPDQAPQASLPDPEPQRVENHRRPHPRRRRREHHGDERETPLPHQEPEERERQLGRDRQVEAPQQDDNEHPDVPEGMDDIYDPSRKLGEQTTHRAAPTNLPRWTPSVCPKRRAAVKDRGFRLP